MRAASCGQEALFEYSPEAGELVEGGCRGEGEQIGRGDDLAAQPPQRSAVHLGRAAAAHGGEQRQCPAGARDQVPVRAGQEGGRAVESGRVTGRLVGGEVRQRVEGAGRVDAARPGELRPGDGERVVHGRVDQVAQQPVRGRAQGCVAAGGARHHHGRQRGADPVLYPGSTRSETGGEESADRRRRVTQLMGERA